MEPLKKVYRCKAQCIYQLWLENNNRDPKIEAVDHVRISKYKKRFL